MGKFLINNLGVTVSTAITVVQYKAVATHKAAVVRFRVKQRGTGTAQAVIQLLRKTAAATVTLFTPIKCDPDGFAALGVGGTAATGITATAEGTDGDILYAGSFHVSNGDEWIRAEPDEYIVPASGIIALKFAVAPTSAVFDIQLEVEEFI